jgi:hypothetical protein
MPLAAMTVMDRARLWPGEEQGSSPTAAAALWFDGVASGWGLYLPLQQEARVAAVLAVLDQAQRVQERLARAIAPPG